LVVSNNLNIAGPSAKLLSVNGNHNGRVFHVRGGQVQISDLTITGGTNTTSPAAIGGGVLNDVGGSLIVSNCIVIANSSNQKGGGIGSWGGLSVYNSTIVSNSAFGAGIFGAQGGGIYCTNDAWIQNCTISANTASGGFIAGGAGVYGSDPAIFFGLNLIHCTVASNSIVVAGNLQGGGIFNASGCYFFLYDTIVADNSGGTVPDASGQFFAFYSLLGKSNGSTGVTNGVDHNLVGTIAAPVEPRLRPLRDNGGSTPTHALAPDSPALDGAEPADNFLVNIDQRGAPRPFVLPFVAPIGGSDGSDIGAFELATPTLEIQRPGTSAIVSWPAYYGDFTLQSATNLSTATTWIAVAGAPAVVGDRFNVTNAPVSGTRFFRLKNN
jgi:hypothetical protein